MTKIQKENFIAGEWRKSPATFTNDNPSDLDDPIGDYSIAQPNDLDDAISAAQGALRSWRYSNIQNRADILEKIGRELMDRREELGKQLSREEGKILSDGIAEVARAGQIFKFYAGEALRLDGDSMPSLRNDMEAETRREPIGLAAVITPWNFPIGVAAWKIAPALACGNCVLLKPSELAPASGWSLTEIIARAGLPSGAFQLLMGNGTLGADLVGRPEINGISFTGSTATGRAIAKAAAGNFCRLQLEMGGKNPLIVLRDAPLEAAIEAAFQGAFLATGQRCTASSRLIVEKDIYNAFQMGLIKRIQQARIDHALAPDAHMGPVISEAQMQKNESYIETGKKEGARLAYGGERLKRASRGHYMNCALFDETHNNMRINQEEIFGPIASLIQVDSYDEALSVANDTQYGLTSGIFTQSIKYAQHFKTHSEAGIVAINGPTVGADYTMPFGGRKQSSYGWRETGRAAKDFYSMTKTAYQRTLP